jgi:hypothetical protein
METTMTDMTYHRDRINRTATGVGPAQRNSEQGSRPICPITGHRCEGDLSHLCEDYGCARKGGLSPHSQENF